jgi:GNAT superfamily N-acetyltransferase
LRSRFFLPQSPDADDVLRGSRRYLLAGPPDGVALLASVGPRPIGLLNLVAEGDGLAEVAVLVTDAWQHHGVGTYLADTVRALGRWQGWTVRASVQAANRPALALLRHHGAGATRLRSISVGEYEFATVIAPSAERAARRAG